MSPTSPASPASPRPALVVGAVLVDRRTRPYRILAARRLSPVELAGRWEFPGGKVEAGETPQHALARELHEELSIAATIGTEIAHPDGAWPISERHELRLFLAEIDGPPPVAGNDHDALRWLEDDQLDSLDWVPADAAALGAVRTAVRRAAW
ncbi:MAG: (deoxy)nucleoside triphosphate pyrophosphohydrolase [Marmoricola sp.]